MLPLAVFPPCSIIQCGRPEQNQLAGRPPVKGRHKMKLNVSECIKTGFSLIGSGLSFFLGGLDGFLYALIVMTVIDYITGVFSAVVRKELSSRIGFKGIFHKIIIFALVGMAHTLDANLLRYGDILRTAVIFYYVANEGISILENSAEIGLPIPEKLKNTLLQIKEESENEDHDPDT